MLLGRAHPRSPLDVLASTESLGACGLTSTGSMAMCCRPVPGPSFAATRERLAVAARPHAQLVHWEWDLHGQQWALVSGASLRGLATAATCIERALVAGGFSGLLVWTVFALRDAHGTTVHLVYDHRTGRFSPFVPSGDRARDTVTEQVTAAALAGLPVEADPSQWTPLWDSPLLPG